jgi:hypothetical protein
MAMAHAEPMKFTLLGTTAVLAEGEIAEDTPAQFLAFMKAHAGVVMVRLDSTGGSIRSALELGRAIRKLNLSTYVGGAYSDTSKLTVESLTNYGECDSACVWTFAGGVDRIFDPLGGTLSVHQFYFEKDPKSSEAENASAAQYAMVAIGAYLDEMGVGREALDLATVAGTELRAMPALMAEQLKLVTVLVPSSGFPKKGGTK